MNSQSLLLEKCYARTAAHHTLFSCKFASAKPCGVETSGKNGSLFLALCHADSWKILHSGNCGKKTSAAHAQLISGLKMMQCTCWWFHSTPAQHIQLLLLPYRALYFSHCMIFETHCTFWVHFLCFSTLFLVLYRLLNLTPFNMAHVFSLAGWFRNPGCKKLCYVLINTIWFSGPNWKVVACKTFNSKQSWFNSCEEHSN